MHWEKCSSKKGGNMQTALMKRHLPQVTAEQRAESDRVKQIRKLRWVGMDDEARVLQGVFDPEHADSVLAIPHATD
jgi:phage protein U